MSIQQPLPRTFANRSAAYAAQPAQTLTAGAALQTSPRITAEELLLPRSIAGVFDLAFDIYRAYFRVLFTLAAVILLPLQALLYLLFNAWLKPLNAYTDTHPDDIGAGFGLITGGALTGFPQGGVPGLLSIVALAIISVLIAIALSDIYQGQTPRWTDCCRRAFRHIPRVLGGWTVTFFVLTAVVLIALIILSIAGFFIGLAVGLSHGVVPPLISVIIGLVFLLMPYVAVMTVLAFGFLFTTPLLVLEDTPVTLIPARNWQLVKHPHARRTLAAIVFLPIVFFTVQMLILLSLNGLLALVTLPPTLAFIVETGISALLITFLQPYLLIFINVLYFDYRIHRDGMDITLLADLMEGIH